MSDLIPFAPNDDGLAQAAHLLRAGGTVAFPTETVYGLGADATNPAAVAAIYAAKGRPSFNPLIAHVADIDMAHRLVDISNTAARLMQAFWPGDLTLVLPLRPDAGIAPAVTADLPTLAVRMPNHTTALTLLAKAGVPVAAPSANPSGRISPTTAQHVIDGLGQRIGGVVMGAACTVGVESTILTLTPTPRILRPGGITAGQIAAVLGQSVDEPQAHVTDITAPGQLTSHYAPTVPLRLNATDARDGEILIGFGDIPGTVSLSPDGDMGHAAATLFTILRRYEAKGKPLAIAPIPDHGIGVAINDRLRRAAAPRQKD
ncbi:MAG: L-threonylcarbamoyladenylate synthase [Pseudomonadota bacterium]